MNNLDLELLALNVKQNPERDINYYEVKDANNCSTQASDSLKKNIRVLRVMRQSAKDLELRIQREYEIYKQSTNDALTIRNRFIEGCERRSAQYSQNNG